jgi:GGDEF domain-containing protein
VTEQTSNTLPTAAAPEHPTPVEAQIAEPAPQEDKRFIYMRPSAWVEITAFLLIALLIDYLLLDGNRYAGINPHPFWIIVLLTSVQYGANEGIGAAVLSSIALLAGHLPEQTIDQDIHEWLLGIAKYPLLWTAAAAVTGGLSSRHIDEKQRMGRELEEARLREKTLTDAFHQVNSLKEKLEVRVAGQLRTVSRTWKAAQAIEQLDPAQVLLGVTEMVSTLMEPNKFSVYTFAENRLQASIQKGWKRKDRYKRIFDAQQRLFQAVVGNRQVLCVADPVDEAILNGEGMLAGPLINPKNGELIGMLKIEDLGFARLSVSTVENFRFICQWIGTIYGNAVQHQQAKARQFFLSEENLYSEAFFERHKEFLVDLARRLKFDLTMITAKLDNYEKLPNETRMQFAVALGQTVEEVLRDTDLAFQQQSANWEFAILLPGTPVANSYIVEQRLRDGLASHLDYLVAEVEFSFDTVVLNEVRVMSDAGESAEMLLTDGAHITNDELFQRQKRFLVDLARRLNFRLVMIRLRVAQFTQLPPPLQESFGKILNQVIQDLMQGNDVGLHHHNKVGEFFVVLPGIERERALEIETALNEALEEHWGEDASRLTFSVQVTTLHE